jgi:hypothetical protein
VNGAVWIVVGAVWGGVGVRLGVVGQLDSQLLKVKNLQTSNIFLFRRIGL